MRLWWSCCWRWLLGLLLVLLALVLSELLVLVLVVLELLALEVVVVVVVVVELMALELAQPEPLEQLGVSC